MSKDVSIWIGGGLALLLLMGLINHDGCRSPSGDLAAAARSAVELARDTGSSSTSAVLWSGRFRLVAVALGIGIPIAAACLIYRWSANARPDEAEVLESVTRLMMSEEGEPDLLAAFAKDEPIVQIPPSTTSDHRQSHL